MQNTLASQYIQDQTQKKRILLDKHFERIKEQIISQIQDKIDKQRLQQGEEEMYQYYFKFNQEKAIDRKAQSQNHLYQIEDHEEALEKEIKMQQIKDNLPVKITAVKYFQQREDNYQQNKQFKKQFYPNIQDIDYDAKQKHKHLKDLQPNQNIIDIINPDIFYMKRFQQDDKQMNRRLNNCPSGKCPSCKCGSTKSMQDIKAWCAKHSWGQACCQCVMRNESGGNANAENYNTNGSYDVGLWQVNDFNWNACNSGKAPCSPSQNLNCAIDVYNWGGKTWKNWSTCSKCGCCNSH
ncbi:Lysozyme-like domain [Pseudocohnilembus persalinus]|uniref:Lysozyme-like domain n=1 Tax=Pseudocohnilembus persalinus TaxID=266149 RepID=A0A0V0R601_PSEPJ|nr:Lysozyme-like domain [Pseudocohnilembus persalinus]|eukprot:KRX09922.1 Lysozyme-like domain [Pseudocohnilembus persalinus]